MQWTEYLWLQLSWTTIIQSPFWENINSRYQMMHKAKVVSRVLVLGLKNYSITVPLKNKYIHVNRTGDSACWSILPRYSRLIIYFRKRYLKKETISVHHTTWAFIHKAVNCLITDLMKSRIREFSDKKWNLTGASTPAGITLEFQSCWKSWSCDVEISRDLVVRPR